MLPYSCISIHVIKVPSIKCTKVVTNTSDVIFNFILNVATLLQKKVVNQLYLFHMIQYFIFYMTTTAPQNNVEQSSDTGHCNNDEASINLLKFASGQYLLDDTRIMVFRSPRRGGAKFIAMIQFFNR
jgi:hypothetical protein